MSTLFVLGFAAALSWTPHCLGMCGGFPMHLSRSVGRGSVCSRQVLFILGKTFTYIFLGTIASATGAIIFKNTVLAAYAPVLRLAAGAFTVLFGLMMLGLKLPSIKGSHQVSDTGLVKGMFSGLLSNPSPLASFVLGLGVGFLPCPLPMAMLLQAAAQGSIPAGVSLMAGMGLGTAPGLLAVGLCGFGLDRKSARTGLRAAGLLVVFFGLLTVGCAAGFIHPKTAINKAVPPCCCEHNK